MHRNTAIDHSSSLIMKDRKLTAIMLLLLACSQVGFSQQSRTKTFRSAGEASQALYEAVRNDDEKAVSSILGCGPELLSSGDKVSDKVDREKFVTKYREMHRLVKEQDGTTVLYIGAENWPFPVPLISKHRKWYFDSDTGTQEVLAREIGQNEVIAIQVSQAFKVSSGREGAFDTDPIQEFALALESGNNSGERASFHGYYFRTISGKSSDLLLVAYPAEYRSSGVMTFVTTRAGAVYEKDLGSDSSTVAKQVEGTPGTDWVPVQQ